jgi:arylsulfatase A-like enzyme
MKFRPLLLIMVALVALAGPMAGAVKRPNIVFVLFDDFGWGQPPSNRGDSPFKTPSFDGLAREGMRFTDAHSAAANCTPTRYGLLTGRYPSRIGQFGVLNTYSPPIIPGERLTVASFLKGQGYHTACIGKWHLGLNWTGDKKSRPDTPPVGARFEDGPNTLGFDYFYGFTHARNIGCILEQDAVVSHVERIRNQPLMIAKALDYIDERARSGKQPFFLYFPMCPPHNPIIPAPEFTGKGGLTGKEGKYADWVYQGDHMLGRILEALEKKGLAGNTLVIATGDNGAAKRPYPPLRAAKSSIYEGGHREPLAVRWPGRVKPGTVCRELVCLNDLFATCADILEEKLPPGAGEDSVSILPLLAGGSQPVREAAVHQASGGLAIRQGPWKQIFHRDGRRELFNLGEDIGETRDLSASKSEVSAKLTALMQRYIDQGRSTPGPPRKNDFALELWGTTEERKENRKRKKKKQDSNDQN